MKNKAVSRWETGEGFPDITLLPQLALILSTSTDELLNGEEKEVLKADKEKKVSLNYFTAFSAIFMICWLLISLMPVRVTFYEWVGFVVLTVFSLVVLGFYLVLRKKYLDAVEFTNEQKKHLFINTVIIYSVLIFVNFCYLPYVIFDPNLYMSNISIKEILSFNGYLKKLIFFIPLSLAIIGVAFAIHSQIEYKSFKTVKECLKNFTKGFISVKNIIIVAVVAICSLLLETPQIGLFLEFLVVLGGITALIYCLVKKKKPNVQAVIFAITLLLKGTVAFLLMKTDVFTFSLCYKIVEGRAQYVFVTLPIISFINTLTFSTLNLIICFVSVYKKKAENEVKAIIFIEIITIALSIIKNVSVYFAFIH